MSVSYTERLRLGQALHGGNRVRRVRRNRRLLSLCAKVAVVGVVALVCTGIAMAAPVVGDGGGADPIAARPGDSLIRLAGCRGAGCQELVG